MWTTLRIVVLLVALAPAARADEWVTPTARTLASPSGKLQAVVAPAADGKSGATATVGPKGRPGKTFTLATPWMPVDAGSAFDRYAKTTRDELARLRARKRP